MSAKKTKKNTISGKKNTVTKALNNSDIRKVIWVFDRIDQNGAFAFDLDRIEKDGKLKEIIKKMISYSNMTWAEIKHQTHDNGKSKHHYLNTDSLSKEALNSFKRICTSDDDDESDSIFSFALQNTLRVIGIRKDEYFHVIWYDPNHKFCPSSKS